MLKRIIIASLVLFSACIASNATDKVVKPFRISDWSGGAVIDERTKRFVRCSATVTNKRGWALSISADEFYRWSISLSNPAWDFEPGFSLGLALTLQDHVFANQRAIFVSKQSVQIQLEDKISPIEALWNAGKLQINTRGMQSEFDVSEGLVILLTITDCVANQVGYLKPLPSANRLAKRDLKKVSVERDASLAAEATAIVEQIVLRAQITDSRNVNLKELPAILNGDAAWRSGGVVGTVEIMLPETTGKIDDLVLKVIKADLVACRGRRFVATSFEQRGVIDALRSVTSCQSPDIDMLRYRMVMPRPRGGFYVLGTAQNSFEGAGLKVRPAKELLNKISGVLPLVLANFKEKVETTTE